MYQAKDTFVMIMNDCMKTSKEEPSKLTYFNHSNRAGFLCCFLHAHSTSRCDTVGHGLGHSNLITCLASFFWKKNPVRLQKKKRKKSHLWCLTDESGFEIFCQTPKKKKESASFKNILCKGDSINYRKLSLL